MPLNEETNQTEEKIYKTNKENRISVDLFFGNFIFFRFIYLFIYFIAV